MLVLIGRSLEVDHALGLFNGGGAVHRNVPFTKLLDRSRPAVRTSVREMSILVGKASLSQVGRLVWAVSSVQLGVLTSSMIAFLLKQFWHRSVMVHFRGLLDRFADRGVGCRSGKVAAGLGNAGC